MTNDKYEFTGISDKAFCFLRELSIHNYKSWFELNKNIFDTEIKEPINSLAHIVLAQLASNNPDIPFCLHISRIYRDARRLYGRGPYKDHLWFSIKPFIARNDGVSLYFEISPFGWSCGLGYWGQSAHVMSLYRKYIDSHGFAVLSEIEKINCDPFYSIGGEYYKIPKGHESDNLGIVYNAKSLWIGHEENNGDALLQREFSIFLANKLNSLVPLYSLLISSLTL